MSSTPPSYGDLGKKASDILSKGFTVGQVKLDASSRAENGSEFKVGGFAGNDGRVLGNFEMKRKVPDYGLTLTGKWNTDNVLNTSMVVENQFIDGLKSTLEMSISPASGKKSGKVKTAFKRPSVHVTADMDFNAAGPTVRASAVVAGSPACGWVAGYNAAFNTGKNQLTSSDFSVDYVGDDFTVHTTCQNYGAEFHTSLYHRVSKSLETAAKMSWVGGSAAGTSTTAQLQLGGKYVMQDGSSAALRLNSSGMMGLSYVTRVSAGVELTLAAQGDFRNLNGHRLGLGLDFSS